MAVEIVDNGTQGVSKQSRPFVREFYLEPYELPTEEKMMHLVAKNMKLKIIDCAITDYWKNGGTGHREDYVNKSYINGDEVILGIYDNPEFRLISFFHEVGHLASHKLMSGHNQYEDERLAWEVGFMIAASHGVFFSEEAEDFANKQLETYKN